jgi:hypothetical protein
MFVIWRRPDGYHGARPEDFRVVDVKGDAVLWLHKTDRDWYPFQVSGGWQDEDQTIKINRFANLLDAGPSEWIQTMVSMFHDSPFDDTHEFSEDLETWMDTLRQCIKGDQWAREFMETVFVEIHSKLEASKGDFTNAVKN